MPFMQPETNLGCSILTSVRGESLCVPIGYESDAGETLRAEYETETHPNKWIVRFSAPGYMDCTDWSGPFDTEAQALDTLASEHNVCLECWESCWDDEGSECEVAIAERAEERS